MNKTIEKIIGEKVEKVVKLHGDASYRIYYRAFISGGNTRIVMQLPEGKSSASEEITNYNGEHKELPFIDVARFLDSLGVRVPEIFQYNAQERLLILEDLGDDLFINHTKPAAIDLYKKAIDLLIKIQNGSGSSNMKCVAMDRSFDETLLNLEFDHFREYFIEEHVGKKMSPADLKIFEKTTREITKQIIKIPSCFVHRDFQSKNLIINPDDSLSVIDFQDALIGPYVYDLVALLRDSYVDLEWPLVEELIQYYAERSSIKHSPRPSSGQASAQALNDFHLVTLQRKMKDAGRFIYIDRVKKNPNFLQYLPTTLRYIKNAFEKANEPIDHARGKPTNQRTNELFNILKNYIPEWKK